MILKKIIQLFFIIPVFCLLITVTSAETGSGRIKGKLILENGDPMAGAEVFFYNKDKGSPPAMGKYFRVPDLQNITDESGLFSVDLPNGKYFIEAVLRVTTVDFTPPGNGDFYYISTDAQGRPKPHSVSSGKIIDLGVISGASTLNRVNSNEITGIEGTVIDSKGSPLKEMVVLADDKKDHGAYASYMTGTDGRYIARVPKGGEYSINLIHVRDGKGPVLFSIEGYENGVVSVGTGNIAAGVNIIVLSEDPGDRINKTQKP
jgi:hypothetical protein